MEIWTVTNYGVILDRPCTGAFNNRGDALKYIQDMWEVYVNYYASNIEEDIPTPELPDPTHTLSGYEFQFCIDPSVQDPEYAILEKHWV